MKQYIKSFALLMLLSVGFVSCNDDFDEDDFKVNYPAEVAFGAWEAEYNDGSNYAFGVNITLDEAGDTICNLTITDPAMGNVYVAENGSVNYDPETGMTELMFTSSPFGAPIIGYVALQRDLEHSSIQLFLLDPTSGKLSWLAAFRAVSAETPVVGGLWENEAAGIIFQLNPDGSCIAAVGETVEQGSYEFVDGIGKLEAGSIEMTLTFNEYSQLVATIGDTNYIMSR